jgi:hypothetical protein
MGGGTLARAAGFFSLITGSLSGATSNFFGLGEVLLVPIGSLINWKFFSRRGSGAFAIVGAGGEFREGVL